MMEQSLNVLMLICDAEGTHIWHFSAQREPFRPTDYPKVVLNFF